MRGQSGQPGGRILRSVVDHPLELLEHLGADAGEVMAPLATKPNDRLQGGLQLGPADQRMLHTIRRRPMCVLAQPCA